jgi:hypothetical protein
MAKNPTKDKYSTNIKSVSTQRTLLDNGNYSNVFEQASVDDVDGFRQYYKQSTPGSFIHYAGSPEFKEQLRVNNSYISDPFLTNFLYNRAGYQATQKKNGGPVYNWIPKYPRTEAKYEEGATIKIPSNVVLTHMDSPCGPGLVLTKDANGYDICVNPESIQREGDDYGLRLREANKNTPTYVGASWNVERDGAYPRLQLGTPLETYSQSICPECTKKERRNLVKNLFNKFPTREKDESFKKLSYYKHRTNREGLGIGKFFNNLIKRCLPGEDCYKFEQGGWLEKYANGGTIEDQKIPTPTTPSYYPDYPDRTLTNYQMGTPKAPMYAHGATVYTNQEAATWVNGTEQIGTQDTRHPKRNTRTESPATAMPYPEIKITGPTNPYMPASPPVLQGYNPYKGPMRLHAPTTTKMAKHGGDIEKNVPGLRYQALNPGVSDAGMYVGPTTQRGITFRNGGDVPPYITSDPKEYARRQQAYNDSAYIAAKYPIIKENYLHKESLQDIIDWKKHQSNQEEWDDYYKNMFTNFDEAVKVANKNKIYPIGSQRVESLRVGRTFVYAKPKQKVIFNPEVTKMLMRGISPLNVNVKADVKSRPTYRNWNTGEVMYDIPEHLKIGSNWRTPQPSKKKNGGWLDNL